VRYFFVNGYLPSPHPPKKHESGYEQIYFGTSTNETREQILKRYQEAGFTPPRFGESRFLSIADIGRISLFVYGAFDAFILIAAGGQRKAYLLGNALRAALTAFHGLSPLERIHGFLLELSGKPFADMDVRGLAALIERPREDQECEDIELIAQLRGGVSLNHLQLTEACEIVSRALQTPRIADALLHLEYSYSQVWGFMVGSYYEAHYSRDRKSISRYELDRTYLENRIRYDLAFVSAFRGMETLLGKHHFKKHDVPALLASVDREFHTSFSSKRYRSWHEVFSSRRRWWGYDELIQHYLYLRNAVSAHGNPTPPDFVMEDQVLEIQYLLRSMLWKILFPNDKSELK
jgi:hypothetical protein